MPSGWNRKERWKEEREGWGERERERRREWERG